MNPADEEGAKLVATEGQSLGAVAASDDQFEEQLRDTLKDVQRTNHQLKPVEYMLGSDDKFDEELRVSVDALLHPTPSLKPELDDLLSTISHHLDDEASERKKIYNRLLAIQSEMERPAVRGFTRYLVAFCIGVAVILAWLSYGEATKQIISTRAPELGWSPEVKQKIADWVQQLGWTKPPVVESNASPVTQTAPEMVAPKAPTAPSLNPQQVQQIETDIDAVRQVVERHLADVRGTVEQLAASQNQMAREIEKLQVANQEILAKIAAPPPQPPVAPVRKSTPVHPPPKSAPTPFWGRLAPHP